MLCNTRDMRGADASAVCLTPAASGEHPPALDTRRALFATNRSNFSPRISARVVRVNVVLATSPRRSTSDPHKEQMNSSLTHFRAYSSVISQPLATCLCIHTLRAFTDRLSVRSVLSRILLIHALHHRETGDATAATASPAARWPPEYDATTDASAANEPTSDANDANGKTRLHRGRWLDNHFAFSSSNRPIL